ncbi:hypothetical protein TCARB_0456 [Thermofilum adornatum 1505]|uniref:Uncharacterized protein n=1 Tax=Thermofilum adornatum 1505 TaxID=697581 RepID=A0A3G1A846_9CREN|nr:hypothetical protein TCARB_0456 [Thermofilum adornatum 1505]
MYFVLSINLSLYLEIKQKTMTKELKKDQATKKLLGKNVCEKIICF